MRAQAAALTLVLSAPGCMAIGSLPSAPSARSVAASREEAAIEAQEVCIGSAVKSAGDLADTLYYRSVRTPDGKIAVGYFVFFSEERPWGNNWLTWTFLPALAVDMVYSRALLVAPGLQRALKGKGDVEGVRIYYQAHDDGTLAVDHAVADDGSHNDVLLSRDDLLAIDPRRPVVYSDVWSHQLGGRGVRSKDDLAYLRCYRGASIQPLPDAIAMEYAADGNGRASPAHVEAMGVPITHGSEPAREVARAAPTLVR